MVTNHLVTGRALTVGACGSRATREATRRQLWLKHIRECPSPLPTSFATLVLRVFARVAPLGKTELWPGEQGKTWSQPTTCPQPQAPPSELCCEVHACAPSQEQLQSNTEKQQQTAEIRVQTAENSREQQRAAEGSTSGELIPCSWTAARWTAALARRFASLLPCTLSHARHQLQPNYRILTGEPCARRWSLDLRRRAPRSAGPRSQGPPFATPVHDKNGEIQFKIEKLPI